MTLTRWTPRDVGTSLLGRMGRDPGWLDRFFEDFSRPLTRTLGAGEEWEAWPAVDVREYETEYVMKADVPGLRREELEIDVAPDYVTLRGQHEEAREEQEGAFVFQERGSRRFERIVRIPGEVRLEGVTAALHDGVLSLHLPKVEATTTRRIEVTEH